MKFLVVIYDWHGENIQEKCCRGYAIISHDGIIWWTSLTLQKGPFFQKPASKIMENKSGDFFLLIFEHCDLRCDSVKEATHNRLHGCNETETCGNGAYIFVMVFIQTTQELCDYSDLWNRSYQTINSLYFVGGCWWIILSNPHKHTTVESKGKAGECNHDISPYLNSIADVSWLWSSRVVKGINIIVI